MQTPEQLRIDKLIYGGDGLGRLPSGEVIFVPWSAPGDKLSVVANREEKPLRGTIAEIIHPSPERVKAPCTVFGICGGCDWQHLPPAAQREWKRKIVVESLERIGKFQNVEVSETIGRDDTAWHYRNRVQWVCQPDASRDEPFRLGYHKAASHEVVEFDRCWIIPDDLTALAQWMKGHLGKDSAAYLKRIEVQRNEAGETLIEFEGRENFAADDIMQLERIAAQCVEAFDQLAGNSKITGIVFKSGKFYKTLHGENHLFYRLKETTCRVSVGSFFQTNLAAATEILNVLDAWLLPETRSLLDVYAGVGTFALHLRNRAQRIFAIEYGKGAVDDALENIRANGAPHIEMKAGDAAKVLKTCKEQFDAAILDPPRAGCHADVLDWMGEHVRHQLLYVSCNPTTLARDLKLLAGKGWKIAAVQPLDMFPQTYHIETLVKLERA